MASIHCGNCGGIHESVAEVRRCHGEGSVQPAPVARPAHAPSAGRGPAELGRSVLVMPGQPAPAEWQGCPRVFVDCSAPDAQALADLHAAWLERTALVVEVQGRLPELEAAPARPVWSLSPGLDLLPDRLEFLLTANCADARSGDITLTALVPAFELGAQPCERADILLPDGSPAWIDGGPPDLAMAGGFAVLPTTHIEHGSLKPHVIVEPTAMLAPDQLEAVSHTGAAARIVAPAGSGKTRVLTERARHLLRERNVPSSSLLLVAFNKRAQLEMKERTSDLPDLKVSTLNALGLAIIRGSGSFAAPSSRRGTDVVDERTVRRILDDLLDLRRRANSDPLAVWIEALTAVRLGLRDPVEVERSFGGDVDGLPVLVERYRATLFEHGLVDFDEQIVAAIELLLAEPAVRKTARRACRTLLVDEFQDLTPAHMLLIRLLAGPASNVFGVGDDDQTIYGFTGASPDWLVDYGRWFPGATTHPLEVNYRCPAPVVQAASNLLSYNASRVDKQIRPAQQHGGPDQALSVHIAESPVQLTAELAADLAATAPHDVIVLTRVNASLAPVQIALRAAGVPVTKAVDLRFAERTGVRAALAWLRLATSDRLEPTDIAEAARRPGRGLSARVIEWMCEHRGTQDLRRLADRVRDRDAEKVLEFVDDVELVRIAAQRGDDTRTLLDLLRDEVGLGGSLDQLDGSRRSVDRSTHGDDLSALSSLADFHPQPATFETWLRAELEAPGDPDGVRLSTVHRVKGREWPHVIVAAAEEGRFPHRLCTDIEEERRVFHVAITRASLTCDVVADRAAPSRFLAEMEAAGSPAKARPVSSVPASVVPTPAPGDESLRDELREWRRTRASSDGVPAFVVFNDRTLDELVQIRPADAKALRRVHGFGPAKVSRYGEDLLSIVTSHAD